jgi:signal peptidase
MTLALHLRRGPTAPSPEQLDAAAREVTGQRPAPRWRRFLSLLFTVAVVAGTVYLWPARFGGATRLVIVSGSSMEPGYELGDVVVARSAGTSSVGDVVVFEVPDGEAEGMLVIHRIVGLDADGAFVTQGDNRDTPDQWQLTDDDVVGEPLLHVPKAGLVIAYLRQWWVVAIVLGLLAMFLLWPTNDRDDEVEGADASDDVGDGEPATTDLVPATAWLPAEALPPDREIDPSIMAEAEAWLDAQLSEIIDEPVRRPLRERLPAQR